MECVCENWWIVSIDGRTYRCNRQLGRAQARLLFALATKQRVMHSAVEAGRTEDHFVYSAFGIEFHHTEVYTYPRLLGPLETWGD